VCVVHAVQQMMKVSATGLHDQKDQMEETFELRLIALLAERTFVLLAYVLLTITVMTVTR
jgi:hypothetical protein